MFEIISAYKKPWLVHYLNIFIKLYNQLRLDNKYLYNQNLN